MITSFAQEDNRRNKSYQIKFSKTLLIVISSLFLVAWFLVLGSLTENRFGTHIVFNGDLISSPLWFILTILTFILTILITILIVYDLNRRKIVTISENTDKIIKLSAFFIVGASIFTIALSAFSFASFNWQFFDSQLNDNLIYNGVAISVQSFIIGILIIVAIPSIIITAIVFIFMKYKVDNRLYYTLRNVSFLFIGASWFLFNVSVISFGAFGGDAEVLIQGLLGISIDNDIIPAISGTIETSSGADVWNIIDSLTDEDLSNSSLKDPFIKLWETGSLLPIAPPDSVPFREQVAQKINESESFAKEGILGVNNSLKAYLLFATMFGLLIALIPYGFMSYKTNVNGSSKSSVYNVSIYIIIATSILFIFLGWITPYIPGDFKYDTLVPGLIAGPGMEGGIHSAIVYFYPKYTGTTMWWVSFGFLVAIPVFAISYEWIVKLIQNNK